MGYLFGRAMSLLPCALFIFIALAVDVLLAFNFHETEVWLTVGSVVFALSCVAWARVCFRVAMFRSVDQDHTGMLSPSEVTDAPKHE